MASRLSSNKYFIRQLLKEEGLPTPRTITLRSRSAWPTVVKSSLRFPLVVKPSNASHANGASLNLQTPEELGAAVHRAFNYIKKRSSIKRVLVEEYFEGHDLRFFVVQNTVVSVVKRDPAYVIGDGHSTIRQLIHQFNDQWQSPIKYDLPLCPIPIDNEVSRCLSKSGHSLTFVPAENEKIYLRWNANVSTGGRPMDVTDSVHPHIKQLAIRVAALSKLEVSGVDILCKNFRKDDISANNISILEVNDSPGFDIHHFPISGTGRNVTGAILDHVFKIAPSPLPLVAPARKNMSFISVPERSFQTQRGVR